MFLHLQKDSGTIVLHTTKASTILKKESIIVVTNQDVTNTKELESCAMYNSFTCTNKT